MPVLPNSTISLPLNFPAGSAARTSCGALNRQSGALQPAMS